MTANGTEISDGASLSGSQVLRVYGYNLTPPYFSLRFNGVEYTPLDYGDGYVEYVLQQNGTYEIRNEHDVVMEFEIEGIVVPEGFPNSFAMSIRNEHGGDAQDVMNYSGYCINYPYMATESHPLYRVIVGSSQVHFVELDENRYNAHNCSLSLMAASDNNRTILSMLPDNAELPCWVEFDDFIIAVFNYTTTP